MPDKKSCHQTPTSGSTSRAKYFGSAECWKRSREKVVNPNKWRNPLRENLGVVTNFVFVIVTSPFERKILEPAVKHKNLCSRTSRLLTKVHKHVFPKVSNKSCRSSATARRPPTPHTHQGNPERDLVKRPHEVLGSRFRPLESMSVQHCAS